MDFDEICERASRNDPELTDIEIEDRLDNEQLSLFGDAAQGNTAITALKLRDISSVTEDGAEFQSLLEFIEGSPCLNDVRISSNDSTLITHQFMQALSRRSNVREIRLKFLSLGADSLVLLLRSTRCFFEHFALLGCTFQSRNGQGAEAVASAFRENRNLKAFWMYAPNELLLAGLQGLESHPTLTELCLFGRREASGVSNEVEKIARIVSSPPTSLEFLRFRLCHFRDHTLEPLVQALNVNSSLNVVSFEDECSFDATAKNDLEAMFRREDPTAANVKYLGLEMSGPINLGRTSETALFFSRLLQEKSSRLSFLDLKTVEFECEDFSPILTAILGELEKGAQLPTLDLGKLDGDLCRLLAESIPKMKRLKKLKFEIDNDSDTAITIREQDWLHAFENNSSLTEVEISGVAFSEHGREKMQYLSERNDKLLPLLKSAPSAEMPLSLRPTLYHAALKTQSGMALVVRDLVALGNTVCDKSRRKRRRPDYYSPPGSGKSKK